MRIYTDLDQTLINPITDDEGNVVAIIPRPGVDEFLGKLSRDGDLYLLTAASRGHAENAMRELWPASKVIKGVYSIEDMARVEAQVNAVIDDPTLDTDQMVRQWMNIQPLFAPGVMFDDYEVGSWMYLLKAASLGIDADRWIEVEPFVSGKIDQRGLSKAYAEFRRRFPTTMYMAGTKKRPKSLSGKILKVSI